MECPQIMDGAVAETFEYDCWLSNSKLQVLLRSLIHLADPDTVFKIRKIAIVQQNSHEQQNIISYQTNLSIDELAYYFNLTLSEIEYGRATRTARKNNRRQYWISRRRNSKHYSPLKRILKIPELYKQFDKSNLIDWFNVERAFGYNLEICQTIQENYFSKIFINKPEFNLNEFLLESNLTSIDIWDFEQVLRKFGDVVRRIVIDNYKNLIVIPFYVREKFNLIQVIIAQLCPNVEDIVINGKHYNKPQLPVVPNGYSNSALGSSLSLYFQDNEIERFLYQLYDKTNLMFSVKKVSNIRIKCDSKSVKKLLTLDLYSMKHKFMDFLTDHFETTYQTTDFINYQIAFPWHCEHYKTWKNIPIHRKNLLQYFFSQTNIISYFNLFDLFTIEIAFYDLNLDFSYYPYLALKDRIIRAQNGNEFNLYEIVKTFKLQTIQIGDLINILRIYGKFIERFVGSEYLVEIPEFQRNKFKKILFHISKYCKNCRTVIMDGIKLRTLVKKFKTLKINDGTNKIFNYELSNTCNKPINEIIKLLNENEIFIEEINVQNYENLNELLFLKILELPFVSKLKLSTYYRNLANWDFLLGDAHKICKFSIQPIFNITLYNDKRSPHHSLPEQFVTKFVKFLTNHNFQKFVKLQIFCYDCVFDNLLVFKDSIIVQVGFSRMQFTYEHMFELSRCKNLDVITFYDCQQLNDDLLLKLAIELENWERHVEIRVESCFITDAFFYRFAEHQIRKSDLDNFQYYGYAAFTKFEFINCHITIDWANSSFVLNKTGDYIYNKGSHDEYALELNVCDYEFYN